MNKKGLAVLPIIGLLVIVGIVIVVIAVSGGSNKGELKAIAETIPEQLSIDSQFVKVESGTDNLLEPLSPGEDQEILSRNFDQDGDTLSGSIETRTEGIIDFEKVKASFLQKGQGWESGDISYGGDSFDATFEKSYPVIDKDGEKYIPYASVTISITIEDDGFTYTNYDIDITLEKVEEGDSSESSGSIEVSLDSEEEEEEEEEIINLDDL